MVYNSTNPKLLISCHEDHTFGKRKRKFVSKPMNATKQPQNNGMCQKDANKNEEKEKEAPLMDEKAERRRKLNLIIRLILTIFYLIFHFILEIVINRLRKIFLRFEGNPGEVRVSRIIWKHKLDLEEISKRQDFITSLGHFVGIEILDSPNWHLYCIERDRAFFVMLPRPITHYTVTNYTFVYVPAFEEALALAEVPKMEFIKLAYHFAEDRTPKTVLFTNGARCGSTLLARMLDRPGDSVCFAEPHVLRNLAVGLKEGSMNEAEVRELLHASIACLRAHTPDEQVCILKTSCTEARLVPLCKGIKNLKHIFMFRKKGLSSVEKMNRRNGFITRFLLRLYLKSPQLARKISLLTPAIEGSLVRRLKPKDLRMYSAIIYAAPYWYYLKNRDLYCYPVIWYHELMTDTSRTLTQLFMVIDFPFICVQEAVECKKEDSQQDTFLSKENLSHVKVPPITEAEKKALVKYAEEIGVPRDIFD